MTFFTFLSRRGKDFSEPAQGLYRAAVEVARSPGFYVHHGVPDTPDGRYDMIALHVFLVMRRLKREDGSARQDAEELAQALIDLMFADMDRNLRELGVGDLSVGRQVKALAAAFQGRIAAYDSALDRSGDDTELIESLRRNIFRREAGDARAGVVRIARHVRAMEAALAAQPWTAIAAGVVVFSAPRDAPIR